MASQTARPKLRDTKHIRRAIKLLGGNAEAAKRINAASGNEDVTAALVWQWLKGKRPVAAKHGIPIEEATDGRVTRYMLLPEVFGTPSTEQKVA